MKITANRKEDILRRKAEYEADRARRQEAYNVEEESFRQAQRAVTEPVRKELEELFAKYPLLHPSIQIDPWGRFGSKGLSIRISVNEPEKFNDDVALSWDYSAYLTNEGEVKRETSSWSGMKAVTAEQLNNLEQTVSVLKELASLDWTALLDRALPEYSDYVHTKDPRYDRSAPDFDRELIEAELEDLIGERKLVEVDAFSGSDFADSNDRWSRHHTTYIAILKDSGTQYTIIEVAPYAVKNGEGAEYFEKRSPRRVKKANIHPVEPLNIVEI